MSFHPLIEAARDGDESRVSSLLDKGIDINLQESDGQTALIWACYYGHERTVSLLIERGADLNIQNSGGYTALMNAAVYGHETVVSLLIEGGVDIHLKSKNGKSALDYAKGQNKTSCVRLLEEQSLISPPSQSPGKQLSSSQPTPLSPPPPSTPRKESSGLDTTHSLRCHRLIMLQSTHLRIKDEDLTPRFENRIIDGTFRLYDRDQYCKFKVVKQSDPNSNFMNISRLENERNILLNLQSHLEGSRFHVKCLINQLEWNEKDQDGEQDLYLVSSETGWIKNDENSKPKVCGLVLELGGMNLATLLRDPLHSPARFGCIPRVSILKDIVSALEFLETCRIVHGDLKPENIVSFQSTGNGLTSWKLIDFENSYDLSVRPLPKINLENTFLTPEYIPPELAKPLRKINLNRLNATSPSATTLVDPTHKMDIWSLGLVSVFVLKGQLLWDLYTPFHNNLDMNGPIIDFDENHFNRWLNVQVGEKEKSFIEDCLRLSSSDRRSASGLLRKSLFTTGHPTLSTNSREIAVDIRKQLADLTRSFDQAVTVEHLDDRFTDAMTILSYQIQNLSSINRV